MLFANNPAAHKPRLSGWLAALALSFLCLFSFCLFSGPVAAQESTLPQLPPRAAPVQAVQTGALPVLDTTPPFDAEAATNAWLVKAGPLVRARADAHAQGSVWLCLLDVFWGLGVAGLLLWLRVAARIRDVAAARTRNRTVQTMLCGGGLLLLAALAGLPLAAYQGFFRARAFGLTGQSFPHWLGHYGLALVVALIAAVILLPLFHALVRKTGRIWWLWAAAITIAVAVPLTVLYPVAIAPLFQHATPLPDGPLKENILTLARANGITATVWQSGAARRPGRFSAHVSGFGDTARITVNSNLLQQGTQDEVLALVGHELGHFILDHRGWLLLVLALLTLAGFAFTACGFSWSVRRFGGTLQVRGVDDVAALPLLAAWGLVFMLAALSVTATLLRQCEQQADLFGVNATRKPDAFSEVILKQAMRYGLGAAPWAGAVFQSHPSGRARIHAMMTWKKTHIGDLDLRESADIPFRYVAKP